MAKTTRTNLKNCIRELKEVNGRVTLKFKKSKKCQSAKELLDSISTKIKVR